MSKLDYIGCVVKTVGIIALVANDFTSFAIVLFIFGAYVYSPKIARELRSRRQTVTDTRDPDS
jgi:hypothetical protein